MQIKYLLTLIVFIALSLEKQTMSGATVYTLYRVYKKNQAPEKSSLKIHFLIYSNKILCTVC